MSDPHCITLEEVLALADVWFGGVASDESAITLSRLFSDSEARIHAPDGTAFSLEENRLLHRRWIDESHQMGDFKLTSLCAIPWRVQALGTVYWQARYRDNPASGSSVIKAVVGEEWVIERRADGTLCFVLYVTRFFHLLPGSAPIRLDS